MLTVVFAAFSLALHARHAAAAHAERAPAGSSAPTARRPVGSTRRRSSANDAAMAMDGARSSRESTISADARRRAPSRSTDHTAQPTASATRSARRGPIASCRQERGGAPAGARARLLHADARRDGATDEHSKRHRGHDDAFHDRFDTLSLVDVDQPSRLARGHARLAAWPTWSSRTPAATVRYAPPRRRGAHRRIARRTSTRRPATPSCPTRGRVLRGDRAHRALRRRWRGRRRPLDALVNWVLSGGTLAVVPTRPRLARTGHLLRSSVDGHEGHPAPRALHASRRVDRPWRRPRRRPAAIRDIRCAAQVGPIDERLRSRRAASGRARASDRRLVVKETLTGFDGRQPSRRARSARRRPTGSARCTCSRSTRRASPASTTRGCTAASSTSASAPGIATRSRSFRTASARTHLRTLTEDVRRAARSERELPAGRSASPRILLVLYSILAGPMTFSARRPGRPLRSLRWRGRPLARCGAFGAHRRGRACAQGLARAGAAPRRSSRPAPGMTRGSASSAFAASSPARRERSRCNATDGSVCARRLEHRLRRTKSDAVLRVDRDGAHAREPDLAALADGGRARGRHSCDFEDGMSIIPTPRRQRRRASNRTGRDLNARSSDPAEAVRYFDEDQGRRGSVTPRRQDARRSARHAGTKATRGARARCTRSNPSHSADHHRRPRTATGLTTAWTRDRTARPATPSTVSRRRARRARARSTAARRIKSDSGSQRRERSRPLAVARTGRCAVRSAAALAQSTQAPAIRVRHLWHRFGDLDVLRDVSFDVGPGEIFGFIGPNGAGKTTTIRVMATLLEPMAGPRRDRRHRRDASIRRTCARCIGYMPDHAGVYERITVREYLEFFADAYRVPPRTTTRGRRGDGAHRPRRSSRDKLVATMSKGMKQRLQLARTLLHDPEGAHPRRAGERSRSARAHRDSRSARRASSAWARRSSSQSTSSPSSPTCARRSRILERGRLVVAGPIHDIARRLERPRAAAYARTARPTRTDPPHAARHQATRRSRHAWPARRRFRRCPKRQREAQGAGAGRGRRCGAHRDAGVHQRGARGREAPSSSPTPATIKRSRIIVRAVVMAGVPVAGVEPERNELERIFLEVTKGDVQ